MKELGLSMDDVKNIYSEDSGSISSFGSDVSSSDDIDKPAQKTETKPAVNAAATKPPAAPAVNIDEDDDSDWDSEDENITDDKVTSAAVEPVGK